MENENKKIIAPTIVAIVTLVMLTVGAAYAYFTVSTTNSFGTKTITATTPTLGSVALTSGTNLTMNVTASQMMTGSSDITYYASENGTTTTETIANIGIATVTGEGTFSCDYALTIDDNSSSLYDAFQSMSTKSTGQIVLTVNGVEYDFNTTNLFPKTISGTMSGLTSSNSQNITAQLKLVNKKSINQSELAGKTLTLSFNVSEFNCVATEDVSNQGVNYVLATASSSDIWNSTLEDDGIRFVGTDPANYVCFGYSNADTDCDFTDTTNTDLYAYRIIGIFEGKNGAQHLKLVKKEALNKTYWWGTDYFVESWESSSLYSNLNELENIYWSNLIETWDYTAAQTEECGEYYEYTANVGDIYLHEMNRNSKSFSEGAWQTVSAKIGLMYVSDYLLSLGSDALNYTSYTNASTLKTGWMHLNNNDSGAPNTSDWTMTHALWCGLSRQAWSISSSGYLSQNTVGPDDEYSEGGISVRPVFYLTSDVTITGEGTIENPFVINYNNDNNQILMFEDNLGSDEGNSEENPCEEYEEYICDDDGSCSCMMGGE